MPIRILIPLLALLGIMPPLWADERAEIKSHIETIRSGATLNIRGQTISSTLVLPALYERRQYAPVWTRDDAVQQLLQGIEDIESDGLNPGDYHQATLQTLYAEQSRLDAAGAAEFDILLTDSLVRLGYHLLAGKVDEEALDANWNMTSTLGDLDTILAMSRAIDNAGIPALIAELRPQHPFYANLRQALARYRAIEAAGGWPTVPAGPTLKPGMNDERVAAVKRRLEVTGEFDGTATAEFGLPLENAVKTFQETHGLSADGVIGPATLAAMNVTVKARIDQMRVNLERARWVLHDLPDEFVLTDIAGFKVSYTQSNGNRWVTRAQVGKPYRKTPIFKDSIRYLEINPTWTVPPTILRKDILPKVARDPGYLEKKDMQVLTHDGKAVDPATIDWSQYPGKRFPYLIRQRPGPKNALGRIKFMFPNKHAVYLHDTPSRSLFQRDQRAFSSGCIRVQNPFDFAVLLLDDDSWTKERIEKVVATKKTTAVRLKQPVTVLLLYWTTDFTDSGQLIFKQDIYDRDPAVLAGLEKTFRFRKSPILENQAALTAARAVKK